MNLSIAAGFIRSGQQGEISPVTVVPGPSLGGLSRCMKNNNRQLPSGTCHFRLPSFATEVRFLNVERTKPSLSACAAMTPTNLPLGTFQDLSPLSAPT